MSNSGFGIGYPCQHSQIEKIKNGNDVVIGGQCTTYLKVLWGVGRCDECGKGDTRLTYTVDERHYCSIQCRRDELERKRRATRPTGAAR